MKGTCEGCAKQPGEFNWVFGVWLCKACAAKEAAALEARVKELEAEPNSGWGVFNEN